MQSTFSYNEQECPVIELLFSNLMISKDLIYTIVLTILSLELPKHFVLSRLKILMNINLQQRNIIT